MAEERKLKGKLNLTIAPDAKERAKKLARKTRRSLSSLFEALIDEEWQRARIEEEPADAYGKRDTTKQKKIGFRDSLGVAISALTGASPIRVD